MTDAEHPSEPPVRRPDDPTTSRAPAVYRASRPPRISYLFRPVLLFPVAVVLLAVSVWVDHTDRTVPAGFVRTTGEVAEVRNRECGFADRGCVSRTFEVVWTDTEGDERSSRFEGGGHAAGDRVDLRYRPEGAPRPQLMEAEGQLVLLLRLGAAAAFVAGVAVSLVLVRR